MSKASKHSNKWNLPDHHPDRGLWDNIADKLDLVKSTSGTVNPLSKLPTHQPPKGTWRYIEEHLGNIQATGFIYVARIVTLIILLLGLLLTGWFVLFTPEKKTTGIIENKPDIEDIVPGPIKVGSNENNNASAVINHKQKPDNKPDQKKDNNITESTISKSEITVVTSINETKLPVILNTNKKEIVDNKTGQNQVSISGIDLLPILQPQTFKSFRNCEYQLTRINVHSYAKSPTTNIPLNSNFLKNTFVGISFTPEMVFLSNHDKNHLTNHIDLNIGYKFNSAFFETGIGYTWSNCNEIIEFDYLRNEFIYKYTKVDSIIYNFDSINMELIKEFVVSDNEIYDSIQYSEEVAFNVSSRYIQIPITFGYKKKYKNISLFVKSGAVFSIRTNNNSEFQVGKSGVRIVRAQQQKYCNIQSNIQVLISAGIGFNINKKLSLAIEPQFRYYFNNQHNDNIGDTYSIGLRSGIYYNF